MVANVHHWNLTWKIVFDNKLILNYILELSFKSFGILKIRQKYDFFVILKIILTKKANFQFLWGIRIKNDKKIVKSYVNIMRFSQLFNGNTFANLWVCLIKIQIFSNQTVTKILNAEKIKILSNILHTVVPEI